MTHSIADLAERVRNDAYLEAKEREMVARILMAVGQQFFETTGCMFICGHAGEMVDGMPEMLMVCPTFGVDARNIHYYKVKPKEQTQ
jgi:hypothetical protein